VNPVHDFAFTDEVMLLLENVFEVRINEEVVVLAITEEDETADLPVTKRRQ
jgi:hypothetical protein